VLDGDPGLGKTTMMLDIAARVTLGIAMPDGAPSPTGGVVIATAEDGLGDTIRPRCEAAGADLTRILAITGIATEDGERLLELPADIPALKVAVRDAGAKLVIIDPLMAFLGSAVNAHRDQDIRRALAPLAALAEQTACAIVVIRHLNKAVGGSALHRGGGSIGIIGAARSGLLVALDPDDEEVRIFGPTKSNLSKAAPSLKFRLVEAGGTSKVEWLGESEHSAQQVIAPTPGGEAQRWLAEYLREGPQLAKDVEDAAAEAGISAKRLRTARERLDVEVYREGRLRGRSTWSLPNTHIGQEWAGVGKSEGERARVHMPTDALACPVPEGAREDLEPAGSQPTPVFVLPDAIPAKRVQSRRLSRCRWSDVQLHDRANVIAKTWAQLTGQETGIAEARQLGRLSLPIDDLLDALKMVWTAERPAVLGLGACWEAPKSEATYLAGESAA
jgi:hypothetical protein